MNRKKSFRRFTLAGMALVAIVAGLLWIITTPKGLIGTFAYKAGPADSFGASWKYCYTFREDGTGLWEQYEGPSGFLDISLPLYKKKSERPFTYTKVDMAVSVQVEGMSSEQFIWSNGTLRGASQGHSPIFRQRDIAKRW